MARPEEPDLSGRELLESHVARFNEGVRSGDWEPMLAHFADDAELRFENAPAGPFVGIDEIRRGYREQPPDDELQLLGIQDDEQDRRVTAAFAWRRGGTGRLVLEHDRGAVRRLVVIFDE
ncbi:MAG: nuclear transport factor 2 family protein [Thermoleophilia bacterium]|nr:nuclear transport factor 2 family protein [Thermoleophilia bacterium]